MKKFVGDIVRQMLHHFRSKKQKTIHKKREQNAPFLIWYSLPDEIIFSP